MDLAEALKTGVFLVAVLVGLPRLLFEPPRHATGALDRLAIDVLRMSAYLIVVAHVLAAIGLLEWTALVLVGLVTVYVARVRRRGWGYPEVVAAGSQVVQLALYLLEAVSPQGNPAVRKGVRTWWRTCLWPRLRPHPPSPATRRQLLLLLPLGLVLIGSFAQRIAFPVSHTALVPSDQYVHLAWAKNMASGAMFSDGIYPYGLHALIAVIAKIVPISNYELIRFAGPYFNTLLVLVLYVLVLRTTRNAGAALFGAAVVGLVGTRYEFGLSGFRQVATLPEEVSLLFAALGVLMALEYAARPSRARLLAVALGGFAAAMTHVMGAAVFLLAGACIGAVQLATQHRPVGLKLWGASLGSFVAGHGYLLLGLLMGRRLYGAVRNLNPLGDDAHLVAVPPVVTRSFFGVAAVVGAALALAAGVARLRRHRGSTEGALLAGLGLFLLTALLIEASYDRFLDRWYADRWSEVVAPLFPVALAVGVGVLGLGYLRSRQHAVRTMAATVGAGAVACLALFVAMPPHFLAPKALAIEYESAAAVMSQIITANEKLSYTVVGTPEWHNRVLGRGFHVQLIDFADGLTIDEAVDPAFDLPIPTKRVFVLTEKRPFAMTGTRPSDDVVATRYRDVTARQRLMETVENWMTTYATFHSGASVFYEDGDIRVWSVEHPENAAYAQLSALGGAR